jgi:hypothetical protein
VSDLRPPIGIALDAFGVDATVTPPGADAVETRAIWLPSTTVETGEELRRAEPRRVLALPLEGLPEVPRGTVVTVPEFEGADPSDWKVDAAERIDFDHYRAVVMPA